MASTPSIQLWNHYTGVTLSLCLFLIHGCYSSVALSSVTLTLSMSLDLLYRSALVCLFFIHHSYWLSLAVQYLFLLFSLSLTWEASFHLLIFSLFYSVFSLLFSLVHPLSVLFSSLLLNWIFIDMLILHIKAIKEKNQSASNDNKNKSYKMKYGEEIFSTFFIWHPPPPTPLAIHFLNGPNN